MEHLGALRPPGIISSDGRGAATKTSATDITAVQCSLIIGEMTELDDPFPENANLQPLGSADATCVSDA